MRVAGEQRADSRPLIVCVTVDTDEDSYDKGQFAGVETTWQGMDEGVPTLLEATASVRDSQGRGIAFTWYVRCDGRIAALTGSPRWVLDNYADLWRERQHEGDELGWHVHLFEEVDEILDDSADLSVGILVSRLREAWDAVGEDRPRMRSSRIGHAFFSNEVGRFLDDMGIGIDSTAMPGRMRRDAHILLDWETTPVTPYRPSESDYRVAGQPELDLIEVPFSMISTCTSYDHAPMMRYVDLAFRPEVMEEGLRRASRDAGVLVSVMHPSEVLELDSHELVAFDPNAVCENIGVILDECERTGRRVEFATVSEAVARIDVRRA